MTKKEKALVRAAITSFMADAQDPRFWEDGMEILSHLIGNRTKYTKTLVKRIWDEATARLTLGRKP